MKQFLFILLLKFSDFSTISDANAISTQINFCGLDIKSNIRGNYQDVAKQDNGAFLQSARSNLFIASNLENCPLRNLLYFKTSSIGHIAVNLHGKIIIQFLQTYEINRIRFWMYDLDARITDIQIFTTGSDRVTETIIFDGLVKPGVATVKFNDQLVSKIRFYNKAGNSLYEHMSIIKIEAYYGF
ncbi:unnamed protein product [Paramecium sonneborni]|uniref:Uncharacterized protein n=1 Tax=Paramecium sonneborni TaxID=65129 RepID=A0A8S1RDE1_9CILI|nr:unnamed protein product [Paramecium sonneborni]CAD8124666.1 unnamed protein product [Paramecium sonneborni]